VGSRWLGLAIVLSTLVHGLGLAFALDVGRGRPARRTAPEPIRVSLLAGEEERPGHAVGPAAARLPARAPRAPAPLTPKPAHGTPKPAHGKPPRAASTPASAAVVVENAPAGRVAAAAAGAARQPDREVAALAPGASPSAAATLRRVFGETEIDGAAAPGRRVRPRYPRRARVLGQEADVALEVLVEADGSVSDVTLVSSGGAECDRAAMEAVRRERWRAARLAGAAVPSRVRFTVRFRLDD